MRVLRLPDCDRCDERAGRGFGVGAGYSPGAAARETAGDATGRTGNPAGCRAGPKARGAAPVSRGRQDRLYRHSGGRVTIGREARRPPRSCRSSKRRRWRRFKEKNKQLEAAKTKQQTSASIMNDSARLSLEKEVDKLTREVQFLQQEAQSERGALQAELQVEFQRKLNPGARGRSARRRACT